MFWQKFNLCDKINKASVYKGEPNECGTSPKSNKFKNIYKTQQEEKGHATHLIMKNIMGESLGWGQ